MENKIFEQMQSIVKDESRWGTIIYVDESDRGRGKSYNLQKLAEVYNLTLVNKYENRLCIDKFANRGRSKKYDRQYVLDEGYSLEQIAELSQYYNIILSIVAIPKCVNYEFLSR